MKRFKLKCSLLVWFMILFLTAGCSEEWANGGGDPVGVPEISQPNDYTIDKTLSDRAQQNTIAFGALAFLTNNLGAQAFYPPGKVADYSGFQYLRDNDPTKMGHNTDFVTIIAFNVMNILTEDQLNQLIDRAHKQINLINEYVYKRFPLMDAFRRQLEGDIPQGCSGLSKSAVMAYTAEIYHIDGQISYDRADLLGEIIRSFSVSQKFSLDSLKALEGVGNWSRSLTNPLQGMQLSRDVNVAVMTYASEMYSWYAGTVVSDTYFCPERQGTYFGSFYLKDWPAMGNPDYTIDEQLTASAGEDFLAVLTPSQKELITGLVDTQKDDLYSIVERREEISTELRGFISESGIDSTAVISLSEQYGELDGAIVYEYATQFTMVNALLSDQQHAELQTLVNGLGYQHPNGTFLYSEPISMPEFENSDFLFE